MSSTKKELLPWPYSINQLTDKAQDGDSGAGPNLFNNCMPASLTASLLYLTGLHLDPDYIWDSEGYTTVGWTDTQHAQNFLTMRCHTPSGILFAYPEIVVQHMRAWIDMGHVPIARFWLDPWSAKQPAHFSPVTGYILNDKGELSHVIRHNVNGGLREVHPLDNFISGLAVDGSNVASALAINRQRCIQS